jgi:hypothetical protein
MKKAIFGVFLYLSLAVFGFSYSFSIKVSGGLSLFMGGDINKIIKGRNDLWHANPGTTTGDLLPYTMGFEADAEFIVNFTENIGLGVGAGYFFTSKDSSNRYQEYGVYFINNSVKPEVSAVPITLNFHYFMPIGTAMKVHVFAGPGLFITIMTLKSTQSTEGYAFPQSSTMVFTPDTKVGFGFQGGLGIEIGLGGNISFLVDVLGRAASPSGFSGKWTNTGTAGGSPFSYTGTGTLWYYETGGYPGFTIGDTKPSGSSISNAREASVGLSGVVFKVGIKINL